MKIEYKILWIDDQPEAIQANIEALEDYLDEHGFRLSVDKRIKLTIDDINELERKLNEYNPYDFIIFDYNLGKESEDGIAIAQRLRGQIFTDMIFYSANTTKDLRKLLFDNQIDGVFVVSRNDFDDAIRPIIVDHVKKISDINNMRGLLLDEMSQYDAILREFIVAKWTELPIDKQEQEFEKLKEKVKIFFMGKLESLGYEVNAIENKNNNLSFEKLVENYSLVDFAKVRMRFKKILDILGHDSADWGESSDLTYIQGIRNDFAHKKAIIKDTVVALGSKEYNLDNFKEIRSKLIVINEVFGNFSELVEP